MHRSPSLTTYCVLNPIIFAECSQVSVKIRAMKYPAGMDSVFKETLRSELDFQDIKVKELSARTGISRRTLEGYLSARGSIPPADVAVRIARALGVTVEYLVTGDPARNAPGGRMHDFNRGMDAMIMTLSIEKRILLRDFIRLLDRYDLREPGEQSFAGNVSSCK